MGKGLINSADTKVALKAHLGAMLVTPPSKQWVCD